MKILFDPKADVLSLSFADLDGLDLVGEEIAPGIERFKLAGASGLPVRVQRVVVSAVSALTSASYRKSEARGAIPLDIDAEILAWLGRREAAQAAAQG